MPPRHAGGRLLNLPEFALLAWALGHRAAPAPPGRQAHGAAWGRQRSEGSADSIAAGGPVRRGAWLGRLGLGLRPWAVLAGPGELALLAAGGPPNTPTTPGGTGGAGPASVLPGSLARPEPPAAQRARRQRLGRAAAPSLGRPALLATDAPAGASAPPSLRCCALLRNLLCLRCRAVPVQSVDAAGPDGGGGGAGADFVIPAFPPREAAAGAPARPLEPGGRAADGGQLAE